MFCVAASGIALRLFDFSPNEILNDQREESSDAALPVPVPAGERKNFTTRKRRRNKYYGSFESEERRRRHTGRRAKNITNNVKYKNI
jgi:hypothetical protein